MIMMMRMIVIIIMMMIIIMIYNDDDNRIERRNSRFLQSPHGAANCFQHVRSTGHYGETCRNHGGGGSISTS